VRADVPNTRPPAGPLHDVADQVRADRPGRGAQRQEHPPAVVRSAAGQKRGQRLADIGRQRQPVPAARLASHHKLARAPVQIVELEP